MVIHLLRNRFRKIGLLYEQKSAHKHARFSSNQTIAN